MMYLRNVLLGSLLLCTTAHAAPQHALTLYNEPPKYPADFKHFDYVNPDAPKGGTFRESAMGGFDSLNPFINKGVAAENISIIVSMPTRAPVRGAATVCSNCADLRRSFVTTVQSSSHISQV